MLLSWELDTYVCNNSQLGTLKFVYEQRYIMLDARDAARIFSSRELNALANGDLSLVSKVAVSFFESLQNTFQVRDVFDACYEELRKSYKHEYYIKNLIARKILIGKHSLNTSTLLSEFRAGTNKADCVILNGESTCYEIKSEYDDTSRLPNQLESYLKLFDKVNVVTTKSHADKVEKIAPLSVGIFILSKRDSLTQIRPAITSSNPIDTDMLMASLRKPEYLSIVKELTGEAPKCANTKIYNECRDILRSVDSATLRRLFCSTLKKTRKNDKDYISALPSSLLMAGLEYSMSPAVKLRLLESMNTYISKDALCTTRSSRLSDMN